MLTDGITQHYNITSIISSQINLYSQCNSKEMSNWILGGTCQVKQNIYVEE